MRITWEKTVYEWRHLKFVEQEIIKPNWKPGVWEKVSRKHPWVVWAFLEHIEYKTIILVEQFRPPVNARVLELLAWVIDKHWKTNEEIITEEIREETWYIANHIEFVMSWPKSPGLTDEVSYDYYAQVKWKRLKQQLWESESIEVIEFNKNDLDEVIESKEKSWVHISPSIYAVLYKLLTSWKIKLK